MLVWSLIVGVLGGIAGLAVARFAAAPAWIHALLVAGALFGVAAGSAVGLAVRRLRRERWHGTAALALGFAAAATRFLLVAAIERGGPPQALLPLLLACASVAWGALGLGWGVRGVTDAVEPLRIVPLAVSTVAVSLALYSVAPLGWLLGLRVNHWTMLGLLGLSGVAWGVSVGVRRIAAWRAGRIR